MSTPTTAMRGGGLVQDPFDPRDHYYTPQANTRPPAQVDLRRDHAQFATMVYNQGDTSSCTANAAAAAAFWYEEKAGRREQTWGEAGPSRLFIYWLARGGYTNDNHDVPGVSDSGSNSRDAMKGIAKVGACPESNWHFDVKAVDTKPSETAFSAAAPHKITSFYRLDPDRPDEDNPKLNGQQKDMIGAALLDNLKKCLAEGFPVAFGFWYYLPGNVMFDETKTPYVLKDVWHMPDSAFPRHTFPEDLPDELRIKDDEGNNTTPGHSVLAIGYDDKAKQVLVQNSWGPEWSGDGTFWMPYAWITDFAASNDFWTIRTTEKVPDSTPTRWEAVHQAIMNTGGN